MEIWQHCHFCWSEECGLILRWKARSRFTRNIYSSAVLYVDGWVVGFLTMNCQTYGKGYFKVRVLTINNCNTPRCTLSETFFVFLKSYFIKKYVKLIMTDQRLSLILILWTHRYNILVSKLIYIFYLMCKRKDIEALFLRNPSKHFLKSEKTPSKTSSASCYKARCSN